MNGRHSVAAFNRRTRQILAGAPLIDLGEICRTCGNRVQRGALFCATHEARRIEMEASKHVSV